MAKVKMKTRSGAKKRTRKRGGKVKSYKIKNINRAHILTKKTSKLKRQKRGAAYVADCDKDAMARMLAEK